MSKKGYVTLIISIIISVMMICCMILKIDSTSSQVSTYAKEINSSNSKLKVVKSSYKKKYVRTKKQAAKDAYKASDSKVRDYFNDLNSYKLAHQQAVSFFDKYLTWSDAKTYLNRADQLKSVITPQLASDKTVFDDAKDVSGKSIVTTLGIQSKFYNCTSYPSFVQNDGQLDVLVKVKQESWRRKEQPSMKNELYLMTINPDQRVSRVQRLS